ncbi:MAG TPA: hypothetical protein VLA99_03730 [Nitrospiraceae bacterium]|nr:hypothetical protein [Nitrospiraceae bacterium]
MDCGQHQLRYQLASPSNVPPLEDVVQVIFDGLLTDKQLLRNLTV